MIHKFRPPWDTIEREKIWSSELDVKMTMINARETFIETLHLRFLIRKSFHFSVQFCAQDAWMGRLKTRFWKKKVHTVRALIKNAQLSNAFAKIASDPLGTQWLSA